MKCSEIDTLFRRIERLSVSAKVKFGTGSSWDYTFPDGETHTYVIKGVRNHEAIEDDIMGLFIWIWNLKDRMKDIYLEKGKKIQELEDKINANYYISVSSDIANTLKHGKLTKSRSGKYPKLGKLNYSVNANKDSVNCLIIEQCKVTIDIKDANLVNMTLPIIARSGENLGDVFDFIEKSIKFWEEIYNAIHTNN